MRTAVEKHTEHAIAPPGHWTIDPRYSAVEFAVKHLMIATVKGRFREFEGALTIQDVTGDVLAHGTVKVESLDTGDPQRDGHLLSPDFFDVDRHPEIRLALRALRETADGRYRLLCEITIRGVTRPITLEATVQGTARDPWGSERLALELKGELERSDFGLRWNQIVDAGPVAGDHVLLTIAPSLVRQELRAAA
ncbi:MAG: YceI family protein [Thermoleophilaceae bacterium]